MSKRKKTRPSETSEYSTPSRRKKFVESQYRKMLDAFDVTMGDRHHSYLEDPYGFCRKRAVLNSLDQVEERYGSLDLNFAMEEFTSLQLLPFCDYNAIDGDSDLRLGAAIWILDQLRKKQGKLWEACKILPDDIGGDFFLPMEIYHPSYDSELIDAVAYVITTRWGAQDNGASVVTKENATGKSINGIYKQLLDLLPEEEINKACDTFKEKVWELAGISMEGAAYFDREYNRTVKAIQKMEEDLKAPLPGRPSLAKTGNMFGRPPIDESLELLSRSENIADRERDFKGRFRWYLEMERDEVRRETGSRKIADLIDGFDVEDPYELCFALFYLTDTGDDAPWLMHSGCALMSYVRSMLPWYIDEDWDEKELESWYDGLCYNQNDWLDREPPEDEIDYYHIKHRGKNLAQVIYRLCRGIVPHGRHPFDRNREELISEGMDEETARKLTDVADLLFLATFQERKYKSWEYSPDALPFEEEERETGPGHDEPSPKGNEETDELSQVKKELDEAKKQIKDLKRILAETYRDAGNERAKAERELHSLRMEHRELADLRDLVFNKTVEDGKTEKPEEEIEFPYKTRKRTVVFGGHDSFLKVFRPLFPDVRFASPENLTFNPDIIRNAEIVWIQNNCISHSQYWSIVKHCKKAGVQMRYFGYSSADKCARQLVKEDEM